MISGRLDWPWYEDLCSCLQVDVAAVIDHYGWEPLQALGAGWSFSIRPGAWEPVEYFHPASNGELARALASHHPLTVEWHRPTDSAAAHQELLTHLNRGGKPIVAVDNYYLPFRPAFQDVHAGHLVVVQGYDNETDSYEILDPMPPMFHGWIARTVLEQSRASTNPSDGSDPFFAGSSPAWRWLDVRPAGEQPALTWEWLSEVLDSNLNALRANLADEESTSESTVYGLPAFARFLDSLRDRMRVEGDRPLREIYVIGWPAQAEAALHGRFLTEAAQRIERPELAEAGREVELVAHSWTGLRVAAAHGNENLGDAARDVAARGWTLLRRWQEALQRIELVLTRPSKIRRTETQGLASGRQTTVSQSPGEANEGLSR